MKMMAQQETNLREIRGYVIANTGYQVKKLNKNTYKVKSQSRPIEYTVFKVLDQWTCECPDYVHRHIKCKHIFATEIHIMQRDKQTSKAPILIAVGLW